MNKYFFLSEDEYIRRIYITVNYRAVTDLLAIKGYVANAIIQPLSSNFPNPLSLSSIAKIIRQIIKTTRKEDFLGKWLSSANVLMTRFKKNGCVNFVWDTNEAVFNSNFKYDWTNQCRFHTM
ncbi:unnamed protein product [Rotaria sordida]|nr:unnamed protein product [Rotaria sordida]CAF1636248.1 unnamed protein product [Rotaria sordida]